VTEALVAGRVGVDITPARPRTSLAEADTFVRAVGGFAGNIGIGLARLGVSTGLVSAVGADGHGEHVRAALAAEGVDTGAIAIRADARTQVAFFEAWPPDHFPVTFYRLPPAPDVQLIGADIPTEDLRQAPLMIVSGALLAEDPARTTVLEALARRARSALSRSPSWTVLDLDWRPTLWADAVSYPKLMARAVDTCQVVIGSDEEFAAANLDPEILVADGEQARIVVVKHGSGGASLLMEAGRWSVSGIAVEVVCGLGAGDALAAAFTAGLLRGLAPLAALERGNAAGAIVASRLMCSTAMPTAAEIDAMLDRAKLATTEVPR
jgi:5-dehydro-2-deoxygluconokinase